MKRPGLLLLLSVITSEARDLHVQFPRFARDDSYVLQPATRSNTVRMQGGRFSPYELTIGTGDTVK